MIRSTQVLWLVRHGESTWNTLGLAQGHCDQARLTRQGQRQARAVAAQLRDRPVGALYASDLRRALETAAPLAEVTGLEVTRDARLRERCLGVLEGAATAAIGPAANGLRGDQVVEPDARPDGGESLREFYRRVAGFADELATRCRAMGAERVGDRRRGPWRHAPGDERLPARYPGRADEVGAARQRVHPAVASGLAGRLAGTDRESSIRTSRNEPAEMRERR